MCNILNIFMIYSIFLTESHWYCVWSSMRLLGFQSHVRTSYNKLEVSDSTVTTYLLSNLLRYNNVVIAEKDLDQRMFSFLAFLCLLDIPVCARYVSMCCLCLTSPEAGGWWNTKGCEVVSKQYGYTVCYCNHTTNFALLLQVYEAQVTFPSQIITVYLD